jgi:hypothetical protein
MLGFLKYAAIPGAIVCGWVSDRVFQGRRAPATILLPILARHGYRTRTDRCYVQCFEFDELRRIREELWRWDNRRRGRYRQNQRNVDPDSDPDSDPEDAIAS